jgi:hypothetical protein
VASPLGGWGEGVLAVPQQWLRETSMLDFALEELDFVRREMEEAIDPVVDFAFGGDRGGCGFAAAPQ